MSKTPDSNNTANLEKIRDLLVGPQLLALQQQLDALTHSTEQKLLQLQQKHDQLDEQLTSLTKQFSEQHQNADSAIVELRVELDKFSEQIKRNFNSSVQRQGMTRLLRSLADGIDNE